MTNFQQILKNFRYSSLDVIEYLGFKFRSRKKILGKVRDIWNNTREVKRFFKFISIFYEFSRDPDKEEHVDDRTWSDLNMDEVFALLDRNVSAPGKQTLYKMLRTYQKDESRLKKNYDLYHYFHENIDVREKIQCILYQLNDDNYSFLPRLLFGDVKQKPKSYWLAYISSFCLISSTFTVLVKPAAAIFILLFIVINIILRAFLIRGHDDNVENIHRLGTMLKAAVKLTGLAKISDNSDLKILEANKKVAKKILKKLDWLLLEKTNKEPLTGLIVLYLNSYCLFDLISYFRSINRIKKYRNELTIIFESIGMLDCSISLSSYLFSSETYSRPEFNDYNQISFEDVYHPLLDNPVNNSFLIKSNSALITGSNMAGKTTFIRTIALNIVLAQTLGFCFSKSANVPTVIVKSFIKREDDIQNNKSYYCHVNALMSDKVAATLSLRPL